MKYLSWLLIIVASVVFFAVLSGVTVTNVNRCAPTITTLSAVIAAQTITFAGQYLRKSNYKTAIAFALLAIVATGLDFYRI